MALEINKMSQVVEDAVKELVRIFLHKAHVIEEPVEEENTENLEDDCKFFLAHLAKYGIAYTCPYFNMSENVCSSVT